MREIFNKIEEIVCLVTMSIMTVLTFANVVSRYVFSASFSFSEEITTYLFVLLSLIGAAVAARRKAHLGFTALVDLAPAKVKRKLGLVSFAFATVFSAAVFYYGVQVTIGQFLRGQVSAGLQWPEWIFGSFVPIGAFFLTIEFGTIFKELWRERPEAKGGEPA